jgi:hypothetical protein
MIAVFYDRKNRRNVTSDQLHSTKFVQMQAVGDDDDEFVPTGRRMAGWESFTREEFDRALADGHFKQPTIADDYPPEGPTWEKLPEEKTPIVLYLKEHLIADLCYKSENCPSHHNWDLCCMISDLVFIRLEPAAP